MRFVHLIAGASGCFLLLLAAITALRFLFAATVVPASAWAIPAVGAVGGGLLLTWWLIRRPPSDHARLVRRPIDE